MKHKARAVFALFFVVALLRPLGIGLSAQASRGLSTVAARIGAEAPGKQVLFLIAIDKYKEWTPLKNPVRDARELGDIIERRYYIDERIELYDEEATRAGILRRFESLIGSLKPEDSVFIYFAGHGQLDKLTDTGFWIPQDAGTDSYEQKNWLSNQQVRNLIAKIKSRHVVLVSDSCFSGDILNASRGAPPLIDDEYFRSAYARRSRQVLTSGASETVPDESSFSRALKLALEENRKPYLDPLMIFGEVRLSVRGTTPLFGTLSGTDHQEGGSFILFLREGTAAATGGGTDSSSGSTASSPAQTASKPTTLVGSLLISVESAGTLYLDGLPKGDLRKGGALRLYNLDVGYYDLEIRYTTGEKETRSVRVEEGKEAEVQFLWKTFTATSTTTTSSTTTTTIPLPIAPALATTIPTKQGLVEMVFVEGGTFSMGSNSGESNEKPIHQVTVSSFMIGKYEVTQEQYQRVMGTNPSRFESGSDVAKWPVESVSWYDAVEFCNRLSQLEGLQKVYTISGTDVRSDFGQNGYRLPTEAEWEYAARGGNQSRGHTYSGSNNQDLVAWYWSNSGKTAHQVGTKAPNELGLFDLSGNVWEWCWDWLGSYPSGVQIDPTGASSGYSRVYRGGCWRETVSELRSVCRGYAHPDHTSDYLGFRVVRTALTTTTTVPAPVAPSASPTKLERQWLVEMVFVQGGTFSMGSYSGSLDEKPVHQVTVSSFMMGKYEVTQEQYQKVMGTNPSNFKSGSYAPKRPVEQVSWYKAVEFCNKLSEFEGLQKVYTINGTDVRADSSRNGYRLPTEAEWEYAAKGGSQSRGYTYSGSNNPEEVAWYDHSSVSSTTTHVVGTKAPNELGLYDMAGNVWEWCWDWYKDSYEAGAQTDPIGSSSGDSRVYRGGSWDSIDSNLQSANRIRNSPGYSSYALGFRVVRRPSPQAGVASIEGKASDQKNADQIASGTSESSIELVFVQGGTFSMGSDSGYSDEKPVHQVTVSSFMMGKYEITQEQFQRVMGTNPSSFRSVSDAPKRPVEQVRWYDAVAFCNRLSDIEGLQKVYTISGADVKADFGRSGYRLPTEAEWEYAARGGSRTQGFKYSGSNDPNLVAWYDANSGITTHAVGRKAPNEIGLYDMSGNVYEWCWDWYANRYNSSAEIDPSGVTSGESRVFRGNTAYDSIPALRLTRREKGNPGTGYYLLGFRVVRRP